MLLLGLLMAGTVGASSGPDLDDKATPVPLPITAVTVFSDRARVTRSGPVRFGGAGVRALRAPDLPGAAMADTLRVTAQGARVVRVETHPVERERASIDQVDGWLADLEKAADKIALAQGRLADARAELQMLSGLQAAPPVAEKDRLGKPPPPLAPDAWRGLQDHLAARREKARAAEKAAELDLRDREAEYEQARTEVQKRDIGAFSDKKLEVLVIVDAQKSDGALTVEYAMPGALWRPAYDLSFDPDAGTVELKAAGLVSQATGEDWVNAKLALSTAIPGLGIALPQLDTWTLGDDREFVPVPSAKRPPRTQRPFQPPAARPRVAELFKAADRQVLAQRTQLLASLLSSGVPPASVVDVSALGEVGGDVGSAEGYGASGVIRAPSRPMPAAKAPMPAPPPAAPDEDYGGSVDITEETAAPSMLDKASAAVGGLFDGTSASHRGQTRTRSLAITAEDIPTRQVFSDPTLPAVSAGGFDYVYEAPLPASVPSQADQLRVPLATRRYTVTTFYEATPSLAPTAYLKAVVKNGSRLPILTGPANIFVKHTFAGDALLATTGPGGVLELPLGADEDIRLTHTVVPSTKTQGFLFGKEDVTDYAVTIDVGNYKKKAVTVRVVDQIPKTNAEKIKVELVSASPQPVEKPNGEGVLYWHVDVPAGKTKKVTFTYRITRPKDWRLSQ